ARMACPAARPPAHARAAGRQPRLLALALAPGVHAEGARRIVLAEGAALAVEDVVRRVVDEARAQALGGARRRSGAVPVGRHSLVGMILAVVHEGEARGTE